MQNTAEDRNRPDGIPLPDRKAAALREIEGYESQARFHNGAIQEMGRLVPDAKANVEVIARCAYLAATFRYHTLPLIEIARLAAQSDHECPELIPIAELAVLNLSGTGDFVRLGHDAAKVQTGEEKSRLRETIEQMRARAECASIEEALERQARLFPPLEHSHFPDEDLPTENQVTALRAIKEYDKQAAFHNSAIRHMAWLVPDAKANVEVIAHCAYLASKFGYHTLPLIEIAQLAAQCDHECPELGPIAELAVLMLSATDDVIRLANTAAKAQTEEEKYGVQQAIEKMRAAAGCASIEEALDRQTRRFPPLPC